MWRANDRERSKASFLSKFLGSAHINEVSFALAIDNRILRLEITIDNIVSMKIFDRQEDAAKVVSDNGLVQHRHFADYIKHLFAMDVLHEEENVISVMVCLYVAHNEWENCCLEDLFLLSHAQLHSLLADGFFGETFNCVETLPIVLGSHEVHLSELSLS